METAIHVLLVEDNPDDSRLARIHLEDYTVVKFHLTVVDRLSKAFPYLDKNFYDVILLDLNLPDSHGLETLIRARLHSFSASIVVLTGNQAKKLQEGALERGVSFYLFKDSEQYSSLAKNIHDMVKTRR